MTVLSEKNKITYIGDSSQVLYPISFDFIDNLDIFVSIYNLDDSFVEDWVYSTQFVIENSNVKVVDGYQIDSTKKMLVRRIVDYVQDNKYREGGDFPAKSTETSFDKSTMLAQQLKEELGRCPKVDPVYNLNITLPMPNAGKALIWNDGEDGFKNSTIDVDHLEEVTKQYRDEAEAAVDEAQGYASNAKASEDGAKSQADRAQGIADDFDDNAAKKQVEVDASAELARKYAQGSLEEMPSGSAKYWKEEAEKIYNRADVAAQSIYQGRIVLTSTVIPVNERKVRYFREVVSGDSYTIDLSGAKQKDMDMTIDLILRMSSVLPVSLAAILGNPGKWMNDDVPDFSEPGEYWIALTTTDGGVTWRGSYEGMFTI